ncbi:MAG TPA: site-2 protease family protein [Coriobacteriia bacterium]|nr:site-2 protease family protein [Coriobacteriia bacterium]
MRVFNLPSLRVGRLFGIPLEVNPTWLIIFALVAMSLSLTYFPSEFPDRAPWVNIVSGIVTALLFFASIVAHELSHSLVARAGGIKVEKVTLFMFGGVAEMEEEPARPGGEFALAVAGPLMSLFLAAVFYLSYLVMAAAGVTDVVWAPIEYLAVINFWVALFNMLPGFPLDGGRVLRAALWALGGDQLKATLWASRAGQFIGYSMVGLAVLGVLRGSLDFIWFGLIGWFIAVLAEGAYRQQLVKASLEGVRVSALMSPHPVVAPGAITLDQLVEEYFLGGRHSRYPVESAGSIIGLISLSDVKRVPREEWPTTYVAETADRDLEALLVAADEPADSVLRRLSEPTPGALLVVDEGRLVGVLTRADVVSRIRRAAL